MQKVEIKYPMTIEFLRSVNKRIDNWSNVTQKGKIKKRAEVIRALMKLIEIAE